MLGAICEARGWPVGHLWVVDAENEALIPTDVWQVADPNRSASLMRATEDASFGIAEGLVGRAATEIRPVFFPDIGIDPRCRRSGAARDCGLVGGYAFPVLFDNELVGVLEFFDLEPAEANPVLFATIGACTALIGLVAGLERARAEREELKEKLRVLLEGSPEAILVADGEGRVLAVNREVERMFGWSADELKGRTVAETLVRPQDADTVRRIVERVFTEVHRTGGMQAEGWGVTRDGASFPLAYTLRPLELDGDRLIYAFMQDLSDRNAMGETLRVTERRLDAAMRLGRVGSWELDVATGTLTMSDVARETIGLQPGAEAVPTWESFVELMHPDDRDHLNERLSEILASRGPSEVEARLVAPDGTVRWISARCEIEFGDDGELVRGYGTTYDVVDENSREEPSGWYRAVLGAPRPVDRAGPARTPEEIVVSLFGSSAELRRRLDGAKTPSDPLPQLTPREREILELLRDGLDATRIARQLGISIHTVRDHLKRIRQKLGVQSQLQAVVKAASLGLLRELG